MNLMHLFWKSIQFFFIFFYVLTLNVWTVVYFFIFSRKFCFVVVKVYIAAFAISGYATAQYRNRYKPFNPVLGETFECLSEDRGFHFISEQVINNCIQSYTR